MLKEWDELPNGHGGRQGFYVVKEKKEWYDIKNEEKGKEPFVNQKSRRPDVVGNKGKR